MKRNTQGNQNDDSQSKRFSSPLMSGHYINQAQSQHSTPVLSPYQFLPYPGNLMYTRPTQWSSQSNIYNHPINLPPPPLAPPPAQPPPPPGNTLNQMTPPIFDMTQPPPPIRNHLSSPISNINHKLSALTSTTTGLGLIGTNQSIRPALHGRPGGFPGIQMRRKSTFKIRNTTNNFRQTTFMDEIAEDLEGNSVQVNKKSKRKPMSARYTRLQEWDLEDAKKALVLENEYNKMQRTPMLILKFPDPDLSKHIVKKYSSAIDTVHFQQPSTPRYCFVTLKDGTDLEKVRSELCEISFGTGKIIAEKKISSSEESQLAAPEEIDPYTLYVGNLPINVRVKAVKKHFFDAARIDMGYAQRIKYTRYAFLRYCNVDVAMQAYKRTFNTLIGNRTLIVRFRRSKGNMGLPGCSRVPNAPKIAQNVAEVVINSDESEVEDDLEIESKANVLTDAENIREAILLSSRHENEANVVVKQEIEHNGSHTSSNISSNLLGTTIKEEPLDDDELLAYVTTYNVDDDFDDAASSDDDFSDSKINILPSSMITKTNDNGNFNTAQLMPEIDIKPDFSILPPNYDLNQSRYEYSKSRTNYLRSKMQETSRHKNDTGYRSKKKNDKDDDDIFNDLNAEIDSDSIDVFKIM